jgi:hypothetical protein
MGADTNVDIRLDEYVCFFILNNGMQYVVENYIELREEYYASKPQPELLGG